MIAETCLRVIPSFKALNSPGQLVIVRVCPNGPGLFLSIAISKYGTTANDSKLRRTSISIHPAWWLPLSCFVRLCPIEVAPKRSLILHFEHAERAIENLMVSSR